MSAVVAALRRHGALAAVALSFVFFAVRLYALIDRHAVNVILVAHEPATRVGSTAFERPLACMSSSQGERDSLARIQCVLSLRAVTGRPSSTT